MLILSLHVYWIIISLFLNNKQKIHVNNKETVQVLARIHHLIN